MLSAEATALRQMLANTSGVSRLFEQEQEQEY